jgi:hypothetical protein
MVSYIGAFPFLQDAPAVLGLEQMIMVITIMTERYRRVLAKGSTDRRKLLFKSLAVYDRKLSEKGSGDDEKAKENSNTPDQSRAAPGVRAYGFAIDEAGEDEEDGFDVDDDELVLAAFESMDYVDAFKQGTQDTTHGAMIPADNFRKLIMLLLLVAPLEPQESLSAYADRLVGVKLETLRSTAECILASFLNVETSPGIRFSRFNTVVPVSFPFLFNGSNNLFEHFLFSKDLDLNRKHKDGKATASSLPKPAVDVPQPLLQDEGSIMNLNILSQLSFFIPGTSLFRRLRLLYSGDADGFSMGSFESKVFNWRAPTILLVRGSRLREDLGAGYHLTSAGSVGGSQAAFTARLPPRRLPTGSSSNGKDDTTNDQLTFGAYIGEPWRNTHRDAFGGEDTMLFQLKPVHDVFRSSSVNTDRVTFSRPSAATAHAGVAFGCPPSGQTTHNRHASGVMELGAVSLVLDSSFEFGCFTHDYSSRGGAFRNSVVRKYDFQERFLVEDLEIWGCGGDDEARAQAERWTWEAREAEARRRINLGTGDIEADRALLEMAGLIGGSRSGGSMG